ncbi:Oleosin [Quillaja saponaria]|uniref:Oleosin n=1 Tax=Quillaja saponaria TaxID=32244 RepID=A0AAD7LJ52_QUISA|nr:Oleosin [Quillaja saponaria]
MSITMSELSRYYRPVTQRLYDSTPSSRQAVRFMTAITIGTSLLLLSALTLTGTVIALILATPILVLFSPILIPAGIVLFLSITGFVFSACCGATAIAALSWIYNYVAGTHPPGADQLDYARMKILDKAKDMKEMAKGYGNHAGNAHDANHGY